MKSVKNRVLVTGSSGFIGKSLTSALNHSNFEVIPTPNTIDFSIREEAFDFIASVSPEFIVHLAAPKTILGDRIGNNGLDQLKISNLDLNIISAAKNIKNLAHFMAIGTCDEYGQQNEAFHEEMKEAPRSYYGKSKLAMTQHLQYLAKDSGFPSIIFRPSVVYGPKQDAPMFIPSLMHALQHKLEFSMTNGGQTRDFVYVDDVAKGIISALTTQGLLPGEKFNLASQEVITIRSIAEYSASLFSKSHLDLLKFGEKNYRASEVMRYKVNAEKAFSKLKWKAEVGIFDGLEKVKPSFALEGI